MMSEPIEPVEPNEPAADPTDNLEGSYAEIDGEPHERTVAGAYTRTDGVEDDESTVGDYTSTDEHPDLHDASERHGKFVRTEPAKPHPGPHKAL
jgi:SpoVK/Ycf46/Vps4 family AAA+-type ATPase